MTLNFLGRGSGFADDHTSAYFTAHNDMIIIDCPASTFFKLKKIDLTGYNDFYVLITHTHGDHIGALGLFAQYIFFTLKKKLTIIAPSYDVSKDISTVLNIEGCEPEWYNLITANEAEQHARCGLWFMSCIATEHSPQLAGKCFGYYLHINGKDIIYTGDTSTLHPFRKFMVRTDKPEQMELYVDTSVDYGKIHLKLEESFPELLSYAKRGIKVYLMHIDDIKAAEEIVKDIQNIEVVTLV